MPQADKWVPEDGDDTWWPDPDRPLSSYADAELRFLPIYRRVRSLLPNPTDAETLSGCRTMIAGYLEPDEGAAEVAAANEPRPTSSGVQGSALKVARVWLITSHPRGADSAYTAVSPRDAMDQAEHLIEGWAAELAYWKRKRSKGETFRIIYLGENTATSFDWRLSIGWRSGQTFEHEHEFSPDDYSRVPGCPPS
ncbi:MAG: hypothetical protein JKY65_02940 [Planctomycetes bacterium]|nr:hypothetical protein [Planctomycetota bacterium]